MLMNWYQDCSQTNANAQPVLPTWLELLCLRPIHRDLQNGIRATDCKAQLSRLLPRIFEMQENCRCTQAVVTGINYQDDVDKVKHAGVEITLLSERSLPCIFEAISLYIYLSEIELLISISSL